MCVFLCMFCVCVCVCASVNMPLADNDECILGTHMCYDAQHICENTVGSFACSCESGYFAYKNGTDASICAGGLYLDDWWWHVTWTRLNGADKRSVNRIALLTVSVVLSPHSERFAVRELDSRHAFLFPCFNYYLRLNPCGAA